MLALAAMVSNEWCVAVWRTRCALLGRREGRGSLNWPD